MEDPEKLIRRVGRRIAELRRAIGYTQEELAERMGVGWRYVSRVERGGNITLESMVRFANALGVPTRSLLEPPKPESIEVRLGRPKRRRQ